jgi:uncharacterized membrane protein
MTLPVAPAIFRHTVVYLALLLPFIVVGFWPTYFSRVPLETSIRVHVHGVAMSLWYLLLVSQACLIRTNRRPLHRKLGRLSYALAPVIALSTLAMARHRLQESGVTAETLFFFYVQLSLLVFFLLSYGLAIANKGNPLVHARYMICTALALIDPIFGRILYNGLGINFPLLEVLTYSLVGVIFLWLAFWDARHKPSPRVFMGMLVAFLVLDVPVFFIYNSTEWHSFAAWFGGLSMA